MAWYSSISFKNQHPPTRYTQSRSYAVTRTRARTRAHPHTRTHAMTQLAPSTNALSYVVGTASLPPFVSSVCLLRLSPGIDAVLLGYLLLRIKPYVTKYVAVHGDAPDTSVDSSRIYRSVPDSIVQQIVSGDYGQGVFQAAYACDRFERVWRELQYQGPDVLKKEIETQLARLSSTILPQLEKIGEIESIHLCNGFVHRWHIVSVPVAHPQQRLSRSPPSPHHLKAAGACEVTKNTGSSRWPPIGVLKKGGIVKCHS